MPRSKRRFRVVEDFDHVPRAGVVVAYKAGEIKTGLTKSCLTKAGDKVVEVTDDPEPNQAPLGKAKSGNS